jgi:hypothetical protein
VAAALMIWIETFQCKTCEESTCSTGSCRTLRTSPITQALLRVGVWLFNNEMLNSQRKHFGGAAACTFPRASSLQHAQVLRLQAVYDRKARVCFE